MTTNHPRADEHVPDDLVGIASMLDQVAGEDRAFPDATFEARIAAATRPATSLRLRGESHPGPTAAHAHVMPRRLSWASRIAAGVAIVGGLSLAWVASRSHLQFSSDSRLIAGSGAQASLDDSADMAFAVAGWGEDSSSSIDELRTQAESLHSSIHQGLDVGDLFSEEGAT